METSHYREEVYKQILEDYSRYISSQIQRYNLPNYGLDPDDVLQDVKIRIWKLLQANRTIVSPAAYIKKIVSSAVIDQLRKHRRDESLYHHEKQKYISEQEYSYRWEAIRKRALEEAVGQAVNRLINSRRQVVKLYLLSFTIQEIASYLQWSQDKTRNLLYRGLADLRQSLKDMDAENEDRT